jgi:hypothetical protein
MKMGKRVLLGGIAVFVAWAVIDFLVHAVVLKGLYEATASLWRPMAEMKMGVMYVASFIASLCFAAVYGFLIRPKSLAVALKYGLIFGVGGGVAMGYGTYSVMPIPYAMAFGWFVGTVVDAVAGGLLLGLIVKD